MNIALFTQDEIQLPLSKNDPRAKHILQILHKKVGECFDCGIIGGMAGKSTITKMDDNFIYFDFEAQSDGKPLYPLRMIIGFPRPIQLKRLFRDMAGLGVSEIHLTSTDLGEKSYLESNIVQNGTAQNLLTEGSVQAKSTHVPQLFIHKTLEKCLEYLQQNFDYQNAIKANLDNVKSTTSLGSFIDNQLLKKSKNCIVFAAIGSERGWTDRERNLLVKNGFTNCSMGSRILRTESASTVAASIILDKLGYLQ